MRNELKHIEEIENYLSGNLSFAEKTLFESRMNSDSNFLQEIELQKSLTERIALKGFTNEIQNFHNEWLISESKIIGNGFQVKWILNTFLAIFITGISALSIYYFAGENKENLISENEKSITDTTILKKKKSTTNKSVSFIPNGPNYNVTAPTTYAFTPQNKPKTLAQILNSDSITPIGTVNNVLARLQVPFEEITMDAYEGTEFMTKYSRSRVVMPGGILQHQDGSKVTGEVTIRYREFRNAAEIVFSEIPMEHEQNGEKFQMNSAGMIEIRAIQNGEELKIGKNNYFMLDYNVTETLDDAYFWSMNDQSKKWTCEDTLKYGNPNPEIPDHKEENYGMLTGKFFNVLSKDTIYYAKIKLTPVGDIGQTVSSAYYNDTGFVMPKIKPGRYMATISKNGFESYVFENIEIVAGKSRILEVNLKPRKSNGHTISKWFYSTFNKNSLNRKLKTVKAHASLTSLKEIPASLMGEFAMIESPNEMIYDDMSLSKKEQRKNQQSANIKENKPSFIVEQKSKNEIVKNKFNHTVYGLKCAGFGVYNCDQIIKMKDPVKVRPMFRNSSESIDNSTFKQMFIIDKNMNSVFSFYGTDFAISSSGRNCFLLYHNGKIYGVKEEEFASMKITKDGTYEFQLTDITKQLQSTEDLKKYLGL